MTLHKLFNKLLATGKIPSNKKNATIVLLFKKGDYCDSENYIPISLTNTACKVLKNIIKKIIVNHFAKNNIIYKSQHEFMEKC
ncbi:hypothetical protein HELRODRAFT_69484 [Helobdella robusta]|uniref:Reverse transcriptase domain-containing protein n=1 Tax=Helobdella robusta TaxID=6412 RepID=T1FZV8_HELRO|nr:hypothetical protein HELRODRAFT_69484 [Helobdella robusta]ESN92937.1 hypothetical protein HELRODRAFT_69484 [Helobdella robusta]